MKDFEAMSDFHSSAGTFALPGTGKPSVFEDVVGTHPFQDSPNFLTRSVTLPGTWQRSNVPAADPKGKTTVLEDGVETHPSQGGRRTYRDRNVRRRIEPPVSTVADQAVANRHVPPAVHTICTA